MILKIEYDTVKLQKVTYDVIFMTSKRLHHQKYVIKWRHKFFPFSRPFLSNVLVALLASCPLYRPL